MRAKMPPLLCKVGLNVNTAHLTYSHVGSKENAFICAKVKTKLY